MCASVRGLDKGLHEGRMIMDLLMMWHLLMYPHSNAGSSA